MKTHCVIITDGREPPTIESTYKAVKRSLCSSPLAWTIIDDSASPEYAEWLEATFDCPQIHHPERRGLGGTVRSAWETALATDCTHIFHCEDDWDFSMGTPLADLEKILSVNDNLAQLSLKRNSVNADEEAAGGYMQCNPTAYFERGGVYVEHQVCFTFNPCLIPRHIAEFVLAHDTPMLEKDVTEILINKGYTFGVYGRVDDPPRVYHKGWNRSSGYHW